MWKRVESEGHGLFIVFDTDAEVKPIASIASRDSTPPILLECLEDLECLEARLYVLEALI